MDELYLTGGVVLQACPLPTLYRQTYKVAPKSVNPLLGRA
jgi:hypothetical protein